MRIMYDDAVNDIPNVEGTLVSLEALCRGIEKGNIKNVRVLPDADDADAEAVRSRKIADERAQIDITLRPSVYAELLIRLARFADGEDNDEDRDWLRLFVRNLRLRQLQGLH